MRITGLFAPERFKMTLGISDKAIDQAYSDCKGICGGVRNDYFGLLYLEQELGIPRERARNQLAFGGNDYGIDGFHFDPLRRNLYLFQFKYSSDYSQFQGSLKRLIESGMERIFVTPNGDPHKNQMLLQLRSCMLENRNIIEQVCLRFVFTGDPLRAERSQVLGKLSEDLEHKRYVIDRFFESREVAMLVDFRAPSRIGETLVPPPTRKYKLAATDMLVRESPSGEQMFIGFVRLSDLARMHREIGPRFLDRNIRYGLGDNKYVNRSISRSLKGIVLDERVAPETFAFNHNGITLFAQQLQSDGESYVITSPRLLNGAQTVTTFCDFEDKIKDHPKLQDRQRLDSVQVLCKIITNADDKFVVNVTVNNNRQNPVESWALHASDEIQLQLHDRFAEELGIYYERQERAFKGLKQPQRDDPRIREDSRAIQMLKLAQTFLVSDGNITAMSSMSRVFEDDKAYEAVFNKARLTADCRHVVLCYKIHFCLRRLLQEVEEKGKNLYSWIYRGPALFWALTCQGLLNDPDLDQLAENFGVDLSLKVQFKEYLLRLAGNRVRLILKELIADPAYQDKVANVNYSFLRTNPAFERAMEAAHAKYGWVHKRLR
jgi:hypothetical protein